MTLNTIKQYLKTVDSYNNNNNNNNNIELLKVNQLIESKSKYNLRRLKKNINYIYYICSTVEGKDNLDQKPIRIN